VIVIVLLASGAHLAPVTVPMLSPDKFLAYAKHLPMKLPVMEHDHARAALPQWYADQFGWQEIVDETAVAWNRLSPDERKDENCGIFAQDYGQAGAIDFLGRRYGLPPALSGDRTLFPLGTARLLRQLPDRPRRPAESASKNSSITSNSSARPPPIPTHWKPRSQSTSAAAQSSAPWPTSGRK
jgi:hypothetical protein